MVLRERRRDEALAAGMDPEDIVERVATFATGTPVANSLGELFVMQSYLRPDLLGDAGVADINDWGAAFTATVNTVEVNPTGTGLRPVSRIGKFTNLQELLAISSVFTDVVTRDQVPMELPQLVDGRRTIITIPASQEVKDFVTDLAYRSSVIDPKRMDIDNILKISNDGRNVSLDPRLANLAAPTGPSRVRAVADQIMRVQRATADNIYVNPDDGAEMKQRGGLQIVFCDRGTPKEGQDFSMYSAIRDELIAQGMAPERIRFIHDAVKPEERIKLFDACNRGDVSVLIGSTQKMGTGTNVQNRAVALHHVDVPWRPADLEQREGRVLRQGNQNKVVEIFNYVMEGTFDTFMWQKVEAKALFVEQVKRNEIEASEAEEIGGEFTASAAETKAAATGDPRFIRQVQLHDEVQRLDALERAHLDAAARRERMVRDKKAEIARTDKAVETLAPLVEEIAERAQGVAVVRVGDQTFSEHKDAAVPFAQACRRTYEVLRERSSTEARPIATINGLTLVGSRSFISGELILRFEVPSTSAAVKGEDLYAAVRQANLGDGESMARGLLQRAENIYKSIPQHLDLLRAAQGSQARELDDLQNTAASDFEQRDELAEKRAELEQVTAILRLEADSEEARAAVTEARERMRAAGLTPGWSLQINPTPALVEKSGLESADRYREVYLQEAAERADEYRAEQAEAAAERDKELAKDAVAADTTAGGDIAVGEPEVAAEPTPPRVDLDAVAGEVDVVAAAGRLSQAATYTHPSGYWDHVPEAQRHPIRTVAAGPESVQVLSLDPAVDKTAALTAIANAAVHTHAADGTPDGNPVMAIPATDAARTQFTNHRYAHGVATPNDARSKFATGQWANPPGTLLIIDDADHLTDDNLRFFIDHAAATNSKLLLVTTPDPEHPAPSTHVAALADNLPWAQHLGTPQHPVTAITTAQAAVATSETEAEAADTSTQHGTDTTALRDLLDRHDTTTATYTTRQPRPPHHHRDDGKVAER